MRISDWSSDVCSSDLYAPVTQAIGFHFQRYDEFIYTPVIRSEIRNLIPRNDGHYTVYLPAHADTLLLGFLKQVPDVEWHVFSKHTVESYQEGNVRVEPINNKRFNANLASGEGLIPAGGCVGPDEALVLRSGGGRVGKEWG